MSGIIITWNTCAEDTFKVFRDELADMFGVDPQAFYIAHYAKYIRDEFRARDLPNGAWVSINFRLRGGGKRAKSSVGKSVDKEEMIFSIKNDLTAKLQYLSTINDRDLMSVCEHIVTFEKGVTANPAGSLTQALSLLDTSTLEKTAVAVKSSNNADYKTNILSKVFYASDNLLLTKKECAIKTVKEIGKGAF